MNYEIRKCQSQDNKEVARLIYDTETDPEYEWGKGTRDEHLVMLEEMITMQNNRFSYENIFVLEELKEGNKCIKGVLLFLKGSELKKLTINSDIHIIKYQNNKLLFLLAMLSYIPYKECKKDEIYLSNVCIHNECRGKRLGEKLIQYFEGVAKERGYRKISLRANNDKLAMYYEKLGYNRENIKKLRMIKYI